MSWLFTHSDVGGQPAPLLMDGAMGTELIRAGADLSGCFEALNLTRPEAVLAIHAAYVAAGARVLLTNTFQAHPTRLGRFGLAPQTEPIIERGVALARQALGSGGFVLGDLGPMPVDEGLGRVLAAFRGVDGLLVETVSNVQLLEELKRRIPREMTGLPVLFSATFLETPAGPRTYDGWTARDLARRAAELGAAALGVNCGKDIGEEALFEVVEEYRAAAAMPRFARPNAGTPAEREGVWLHPRDAAAWAGLAARLTRKGRLSLVGGCCGTTPAHIRALGELLATDPALAT